MWLRAGGVVAVAFAVEVALAVAVEVAGAATLVQSWACQLFLEDSWLGPAGFG